MQEDEPDGCASGPKPGSGGGRVGRRFRRAIAAANRSETPISGGALAAWLAWLRAQPILAAALLGFGALAVGGLVLSLPRDTPPTRRVVQHPGAPATGSPTTPPETPASEVPNPPAGAAPGAQPGPWVDAAPSSSSPRGLALAYRYRTLPPGGESRFEWIVQVRGARAILDIVDVVKWSMEPPAANEADLISRDRAADGFPLFGDGPGGWFGVTAAIRYRDGGEETLSRRIDLSD